MQLDMKQVQRIFHVNTFQQDNLSLLMNQLDNMCLQYKELG